VIKTVEHKNESMDRVNSEFHFSDLALFIWSESRWDCSLRGAREHIECDFVVIYFAFPMQINCAEQSRRWGNFMPLPNPRQIFCW
jgi:hypothetical protein